MPPWSIRTTKTIYSKWICLSYSPRILISVAHFWRKGTILSLLVTCAWVDYFLNFECCALLIFANVAERQSCCSCCSTYWWSRCCYCCSNRNWCVVLFWDGHLLFTISWQTLHILTVAGWMPPHKIHLGSLPLSLLLFIYISGVDMFSYFFVCPW